MVLLRGNWALESWDRIGAIRLAPDPGPRRARGEGGRVAWRGGAAGLLALCLTATVLGGGRYGLRQQGRALEAAVRHCHQSSAA